MSRRPSFKQRGRDLLWLFSTAALKRIANPRYPWRSTSTFDGEAACLIGQAIPSPGGRDDYLSFKRSCPQADVNRTWEFFDEECRVRGYAETKEVGAECSAIAAEILKERAA